MHRISLSDVAELAGVSVATVSRVIHSPAKVQEETRQQVLAAMKTMNYIPNRPAQQLRQSRSYTVGHIMGSFTPDNPFHVHVALAVERELLNLGYSVFTVHTNTIASERQQQEMRYVRLLLAHRVDGIIFTPTVRIQSLQLCQEVGVPVVQVERPVQSVDTDRVVCDNYPGELQAVRHLTGLGHRHIAYIGLLTPACVEQQRLAGYKDGMKDAGLEGNILIADAPYSRETACQVATELLQTHPEVTAILTNDPVIPGVVRAFNQRGIRIPEDMSLIGHDDTISSFWVPQIATISIPMDSLGIEAARLLVRRIDEQEHVKKNGGIVTPPRIKTLQTTLVLRESTGPSRVD